MLRIVRQGSGWTVQRDGKVVKDGISSGIHKTEDVAVGHVIRLAAESGEGVESRVWTRHHSNGWLAQVYLTQDGGLGWQAVRPNDAPSSLKPALDIEEARDAADAAVRAEGHDCSRACGSW